MTNNETTNLANVSVGDTVIINIHGDNGIDVRKYEVIDNDDKSIAVPGGCGKWWFYRDTGDAYTGNAKIVGIEREN